MNKETALSLLGGGVNKAARTLGLTHSAVSQWPTQGPISEIVTNKIVVHLLLEGRTPIKRLRELAAPEEPPEKPEPAPEPEPETLVEPPPPPPPPEPNPRLMALLRDD